MFSFALTPERPPHKCISCEAGTDREWYFDLGEHTNSLDEIMPTIYVCNLCFTAAAKEQGIVDQSPLLDEIDSLKEQVFNYKTTAEALEHGFNDLIRARFLASDDPLARDIRDLLEARKQADGGPQAPGGDESSLDRVAPEPGAGQDMGAIPTSFSLDGGPARQ